MIAIQFLNDFFFRRYKVLDCQVLRFLSPVIISLTQLVYYPGQTTFSDLMYGQHDILRLITRSLSACHQMSVREAAGELSREVLYDGEYKHGEVGAQTW